MSGKRNADGIIDAERRTSKHFRGIDDTKKHSLDSDEEDVNEDQNNVLDEADIEGEEEGTVRQDGETRMTAFNMQDEMQEGHFDRDGHFIWNNEKEVRDNWLDNIDWHKVKDKDKTGNPYSLDEKGLGEESDSDTEMAVDFNEIETYKKIHKYLKPKETISKALRRLGGDTTKLSSVERLRRKKAGTLVENKEVTELTALANEVLTQMGNMDVYQETFEQIGQKIDNHDKKNKSKANIVEAELDMYADDFDNREQQLLHKKDGDGEKSEPAAAVEEEGPKKLMWEFKWEQDKDKIEGPFDTEQMNKWSNEGHFKTGVWVRKCGSADSNFYSSNRIDFDLYL